MYNFNHLSVKEIYVYSRCCGLLSIDWVLLIQLLLKFSI